MNGNKNTYKIVAVVVAVVALILSLFLLQVCSPEASKVDSPTLSSKSDDAVESDDDSGADDDRDKSDDDSKKDNTDDTVNDDAVNSNTDGGGIGGYVGGTGNTGGKGNTGGYTPGGNNPSPDPGSGPGTGPEPSEFTITFVTNGGTAQAPIKIAKGQACNDLPIPIKKNNFFAGWYTDVALTNPFVKGTTITADLTLYAKYLVSETSYENDIEEISTLNQIAEELPVATNFEIQVTTTDTSLTAAQVQEMLRFVCVSETDDRGVSVTGSDGSFTVYMDGGFKPAADYTLTLPEDGFCFTGKEETARGYSFHIEKEEAENLPLRNEIIYLPANTISDIFCDGKSSESLSAAVFSFSEESTEAPNISGSFTYVGDKTLKAGDTLCVYSGAIPTAENAEETLYDDIAYVKVTNVQGTTISYTNAEAEQVLQIPKTAIIQKSSVQNLLEADEEFSFQVDSLAAETLSIGDDNPVQRQIEIGDTIALYDAPSVESATEDDVMLGKVTALSGSGPYTITCVLTTQEQLMQSVDYYQNIPIDLGDVMDAGSAEMVAITEKIQQQTLESGIVDELAAQYSLVALETNLLEDTVENAEEATVLMSDGTQADVEQLLSITAEDTPKKKVDVGKPKVKVSIAPNGGTAIPGAFKATIDVSFDVTFKTKAGDSVKLGFGVTFVQELSFSVEANAGIDWGGWWIFRYPEECRVYAALSVKTYSGVELKATLTTESADSDKTIDISDKIKEAIGGTEEGQAVENVSGIYKHYQEFMENDLDYIEVVRQSMGKVSMRVCVALVEITVEPSFVVNAAANAAITCNLSYQEGTKYVFSARLSEMTATFNKTTLMDKKFNFSLYLVGNLGLRVGIELDLRAGLISTALNSMGIVGQTGFYVQWCGFFSYEYERNFTADTTKSEARGAMYTEVGVYLDLTARFQLGSSGSLRKDFALVSERYPLLSTNTRNYIYDFAYTLDKDEKLIINATQNALPDYALKMTGLDLVTGKSWLQTYYANLPEHTNLFNFAFTNDAFSLHNGRIVVNSDADYLETDMIVAWKSSPLAFTSIPIKRTFHVVYTDSEELTEKGLVTVKINGSPAWSKRISLGANLADAVPTRDEILALSDYGDYNRTVGNATVNIRYASEGDYTEVISGTVNGSLELNYELPLREYTVTVEGVQGADGSISTQNLTTNYNGTFDLSGFNTNGYVPEDQQYTKFTGVETRIGGKAAGLPLSGTVGEALALQILNGNHTYHAAYVDDTARVKYVFSTFQEGAIANYTEVFRNNSRPAFDYTAHVENAGYLILRVEGDVATPVNGTRTIHLTCAPADGYTLTLHRNGGVYAPNYTAPSEYDTINGTMLPNSTEITKKNYVFAGWYENSDFSGEPITEVKGNLGPKQYYACWISPEYTLRLDSNDGAGNTFDVSAVYDKPCSLGEIEHGLVGQGFGTMTLTGWNTKPDGDGTAYEVSGFVKEPEGISSSGVVTLYAQWNESVKVDYQPASGLTSPKNGIINLSDAVKYSSLYQGTITLLGDTTFSNRDLILHDGVTLVGGANLVTNGKSTRIFSTDGKIVIEEGSQVSMSTILIEAALQNAGTLTIDTAYIGAHIGYGGAGYSAAQINIGNLETGRLVMSNTMISRASPTGAGEIISNAGVMVLDSVSMEYCYSIGNTGTLVLNNAVVANSSNGPGIANNGGALYLLNTTVTANRGGGIAQNSGTLHMVNSISAMNSSFDLNSGSGAHIYYSTFGAAIPELESNTSVLSGVGTPYNAVNGSQANLVNSAPRAYLLYPQFDGGKQNTEFMKNTVNTYLDYSNLDNIRIAWFDQETYHDVLNASTQDDSILVTTKLGGGVRDLTNNRVGAYWP